MDRNNNNNRPGRLPPRGHPYNRGEHDQRSSYEPMYARTSPSTERYPGPSHGSIGGFLPRAHVHQQQQSWGLQAPGLANRPQPEGFAAQGLQPQQTSVPPRYVPPHVRRGSVITPMPVPRGVAQTTGTKEASNQGRMSSNYRGSRSRPDNLSANIPDNQNTSVWIQGLPPTCGYDMLLGRLKDTGKIFATVINQPVGLHPTCAAKVVFWDRAGVDNLLRKAARGEFVFPGNYSPTVELNRIKTSAQAASNRSRVIIITGPESFVNWQNLNRFFSDSITFQLEQVAQVEAQNPSTTAAGVVTMRWAFGSYRLQAQSAFKKLYDAIGASRVRGDNPDLAAVQIAWGPDPCEPIE
ncbi:hypothetical protein F5Y17DRAFT_454886 [Xylariaceae sp. FL0594]|nr:hypothetical protein F5Y17DRAFT_454886 [Xylariaceae sp. FL0594]